MKKEIDLSAVLSGEYKEIVEIAKGLSVIMAPMSFRSREEVSRLERTEFNKDPNASFERSTADRNMFVGKCMAYHVIKSAKICDKEITFDRSQDVQNWMDDLSSAVAEIIISSVVNFVSFYVRETEAAHHQDPFDLRESEQKQSSPQEESS